MPPKQPGDNTPVPTLPPDDEGFLSRWSRRKREAIDGSDAGIALPVNRDTPPDSVAAAEALQRDDEPEPVLPPLHELTPDSDLSGFMSPKVSAELRHAALRRVFSSARFNVCDGLDDYAEDFRELEVIAGTAVHELREMLARQERTEIAQARAETQVNNRASTPKAVAGSTIDEPQEGDGNDAESEGNDRTDT